MSDSIERELADVRASRMRLVAAADADRRAIEGALHDGVQQHLVALAVDLRRLEGLIDTDQVAARALVGEMTVNIRSAMDDAAKLAERIHPPLLEARGFAAAIRSSAERAGVSVVVDAPPGASYPPEVTTAIYWSCVEALAAASPGSQATVGVHEADGLVTLDVTVVGQLTEGRLTRLRDRIAALDGGVSVDHVADGSRVHGWLPLSR